VKAGPRSVKDNLEVANGFKTASIGRNLSSQDASMTPLKHILVALVVATPATSRIALAQASDPNLARLQAEIVRLSAISGGKVGVGIIHVESGRELFVNGSDPFPMASTYKVPIAVQLLTRVHAGAARLDSMITLRPSDLHPGSGTLTGLFNDPGVSVSLHNLLELMLLISDNSATDIVLRAAGGAWAVNGRLRDLGISGISVDRPTISLIADAVGVKDLGPESGWSVARFDSLRALVTSAEQQAARVAFYEDRRDTATPEGMARLLSLIQRGQAVPGRYNSQLLNILLRVETGAMRLKGMLPPGIPVMHKTGSLGIGVTNDVGIIDLPDAGHLVVAVFVKESTRDVASQERAIAQIARAAYDYFTFNPIPGR
jgi:beta-lactamase class A